MNRFLFALLAFLTTSQQPLVEVSAKPHRDMVEKYSESPFKLSDIFTVRSGPCTITKKRGGRCVQSPNFPALYGNNEKCIITVHGPVELSVEGGFFNVEDSDRLYVDPGAGQYDIFSGDVGPDNYPVLGRFGKLIWITDASNPRLGWRICANPLRKRH